MITNSSKKCLVISAGGLTGAVYLGVLHTLYERGELKNITHYYGTSAGAIISGLLGLGFTPFQIFCEMCEYTKPFEAKVAEFLFDKTSTSLTTFQAFEHHLCTMFQRKCGKIPTFEYLASLGKHVHMYAHSLTTDDVVEFSNTTTPDLNILDAMIASASIPFVFPTRTIGMDTYIDGALSNPIPIANARQLFDDRDIILICSQPKKIKRYIDENYKFGILLAMVYQTTTHLARQTLKLLTPDIQHYIIGRTDAQLIVDSSLNKKWDLFLSGTTEVPVTQAGKPNT